jgi:hypothetical protein
VVKNREEKAMNLVRLVYASRFAEDVKTDGLREILEQSRRNNPKEDISGVLCYGPGLFLQCLEGPRDAVNQLYRTIVNDHRNKDATLIEYANVDERMFEKWDMAYVRSDAVTGRLLLKYSSHQTFDPYRMTPGQALGFLKSIRDEKEHFLDASHGND